MLAVTDMKKSYTYYLAGVLTGIIIGIGLAWIIRQSSETRRNYIDRQPVSFNLEEAPPAKSTTPVSTESSAPLQIDSTATADTLETATDTLIDSLKKITVVQDTILPDNDSLFFGSEDDIVVMEDKLIAVKTVPIYNTASISTSKESGKNLDSLLIDDKHSQQQAPESLEVEFWKSPINYTGYRRINERLILFGLNQKDSIRIYERESRLFMNIRDKDFPLNETDNFRSIWFNID